MKVHSIAEQLLFTTVIVEAKTLETEIQGTAFIFEYRLNNENYLFIVTNRHVVEGTTEGVLVFIRGKERKPLLGYPYIVHISDFEDGWFFPSNKNIDVAVMPFVPIINEIKDKGDEIYFMSVSSNLIPTTEDMEKIDAVEEVLFIGYPERIWDKKNLLPIIRKGITATPIYIDFNGEKQFLIDASVFPGSSGSPVFIFNKGFYWDKKSNSTVAGNRIYFLGVLTEVFQAIENKEIIIPTSIKPTVEVEQLLDLGVVFKAEVIVETIRDLLKSRGLL